MFIDRRKLRRKARRIASTRNRRCFPFFRIDNRCSTIFHKDIYINGKIYYIYSVRDLETNQLRFISSRLTTEQEQDYIENTLGSRFKNYEVIELSITKNMRQALNAIKADAKNNANVEDFFDFEMHWKTYEEIKEYMTEE